MALPLSEVLLDWSKNAKVAGGVLIDSFSHTDEHAHEIIDDDESDETLLGIGATPATRKRLEEMEIPLLKQGVIAGMTGLLLGECRRRGLDTFAILAEANGPPGAGLPDARAAARIIEKLDLLFPNLSLPTDPLIEEAERIEEQIREMLEGSSWEIRGRGRIFSTIWNVVWITKSNRLRFLSSVKKFHPYLICLLDSKDLSQREFLLPDSEPLSI